MAAVRSYEQVATERLIPYPGNPRRGDIEKIAESIRANGFYGALVVQRSTNYVLAGNHRLLAAQSLGIKRVPVVWADVDDAAAKRILIVDNRSSDLAVWDEAALAELLGELPDLTGTLFTTEDLAKLLVAPPDEFRDVDPDGLPVQYRCPSCGYEWSGSPAPGKPEAVAQ